MRRFFRRAKLSGLLLPWAVSLALVTVLIYTENVGLAVAVVLVAVVGSTIQIMKHPVEMAVTWENAVSISRPNPPKFHQIDQEHPLVALVTAGERRGVYVNVLPSAQSNEWIYQAGPSAWGAPPSESENILTGDVSDGKVIAALRFLPQGDFSDEIWRRNFDSFGRGATFRALPRIKARSRSRQN